MSVVCNLKTFPPAARHGVLCVGNFDGVHRGHARMLAYGRQLSEQIGCPFVIMTFAIHPLAILTPCAAPTPLTTLDQRLELLQNFSPDALILIEPNREFLAMPAETFLRQVVGGIIGARHLVEGPTFTFGRGAAGNVAMLENHDAASGFRLTVVPTVEATLGDFTLVTVSSSLCRWLISHGRVQDAAKLLGRAYTLRAPVAHGAGRGKILGFPTVNLAVGQLLAAQGVYAGRAMVAGRWYAAAISVGTNPTFGENQVSVEAFLLDFTGDAYDASIDLAFDEWIRDQQPFSGSEPLQRRIAMDVQTVRRVQEKLRVHIAAVGAGSAAGDMRAHPSAASVPTMNQEQQK